MRSSRSSSSSSLSSSSSSLSSSSSSLSSSLSSSSSSSLSSSSSSSWSSSLSSSSVWRVFIVALLTFPVTTFAQCPCSNSSWCDPVTIGPRQELFAFRVTAHDPQDTIWRSFNWSILTTLAVFGNVSDTLLCYAHEHGVRIVRGWDLPNDELTNTTFVQEWVETTAAMVRENFWDGINLDIEGNAANADALTTATQLLAEALRKDNPFMQLSFDTAALPLNYQGHGYDFVSLASICDFLVPMFYDMNWGSKVAEANANYVGIVDGITQYTTVLQIPPSKLVAGLPWYSYNFPCINPPPPPPSAITTSASSSSSSSSSSSLWPECDLPVWGPDAGSWQQTYAHTVDALLPLSLNSSYVIDPRSQSGVFSYAVNDTDWNQVWFDPPETLLTKYQTMKTMGLRGVGMWYAECLNYTEGTQVNEMWTALSVGFFS